MNFAIHQTAKGALSLKITYYGEEGTELSEYFRMDTHAQRGSFYHRFVRMHHKAPGKPFWVKSMEHVIERKEEFRRPDFVIGRKDGKFWRIQTKLSYCWWTSRNNILLAPFGAISAHYFHGPEKSKMFENR